MKKTQTFRAQASLGALVLAAAGLLSACIGAVDVGDAMDGSGGSSSGGGTGSGGSGEAPAGDPACAEQDAQHAAPYDAWLAAPNDFGALAGSAFSGYLEGGGDLTLTLTIASDHTASLLVGEAPAPPPVVDEGYLCKDEFTCSVENELRAGGTYPVHGATFEDGRLLVPLQIRSAYDPWCVLQTPVSWGDCYFDVYANGTSTWDDEVCFLGDEQVDCPYFQMVINGSACSCTSAECFAAISTGGPTDLIDVRFEAAENKLEGSMGGTNVHLFRVVD